MKRKPRIQYEWTMQAGEWRVTWGLYGANGEYVCGSGQGSRDKHDAQRQVETVLYLLTDGLQWLPVCRQVGPGRKPKL